MRAVRAIVAVLAAMIIDGPGIARSVADERATRTA